jgi:hypothetical protein
MFRSIHLHPRFDKQLNALKRGDRKAARAAETGERLVEALTRGLPTTEGVAAPTRSGEWRIKGCRKYDLGSGYRLVTILHGRRLYMVCIGTHDECDRWLETNRDWEPELSSKRLVVRTVRKVNQPNRKTHWKPLAENPADPVSLIDQKMLRIVFSGLCEGTRK